MPVAWKLIQPVWPRPGRISWFVWRCFWPVFCWGTLFRSKFTRKKLTALTAEVRTVVCPHYLKLAEISEKQLTRKTLCKMPSQILRLLIEVMSGFQKVVEFRYFWSYNRFHNFGFRLIYAMMKFTCRTTSAAQWGVYIFYTCYSIEPHVQGGSTNVSPKISKITNFSIFLTIFTPRYLLKVLEMFIFCTYSTFWHA